MFHEDDLLPISALQHLLFCERQCALIHVERLWEENRLTAEGRHMHDRAHQGEPETRGGLRTVRGLMIRSLRWGIVGQADVVEFLAPDGTPAAHALPNRISAGTDADWSGWTVTPVEYKRGRPKKDDCDRVQLCAQALCLEEMLGVGIEVGSLFYGQRRRRTVVPLDEALRQRTVEAIRRLREMIVTRETPPAVREPKCNNCSLFDLCLPDTLSPRMSASQFFDHALDTHMKAADELGVER